MPSFSHPSTQYQITRSFWGGNYNLTSGGTTVYHVESSSLTPGKPDLTFHAGRDARARVVGVCKFRHFSSDTEIGIGSPRSGMRWERLAREGIMSVRYSFRVTIGRTVETFTWKKTHSMGRGIMGNLKLVRERDAQIMAVISGSSGFTSRSGQMDLYCDSFGSQFKFMVVITGMALRERLRRASAAASGGGGGGGGA